jgi:hypothetical protein
MRHDMKKVTIDFNCNETVEITLNENGAKIYNDYYKQFDTYFNENRRHKNIQPGVRSMQLWDVMNIFGPHLGLGKTAPFEKFEIRFTVEVPDES